MIMHRKHFITFLFILLFSSLKGYSQTTIDTHPNVCVSADVTWTGSPGGGTWSTTSGTGSVTVGSSSGIVTGVTAGTATIVYSVTGTGSVSATVTVNTTPSAISGTAVVCSLTTSTLSCSPSAGTWSSSNGNVTVGS